MQKSETELMESISRNHSEILSIAKRNNGWWNDLCERFLPCSDSIWRFSRERFPQDPTQGWKLHISATILEACELLEKVAPFLIAQKVRFKAPKSLEELSRINQGLVYGYHQVGKFLTVYPANEAQAVSLAEKLHILTEQFNSVTVPFDEQYVENSSVFYRYGSFIHSEQTDENGNKFLVVKHPNGDYVKDDRLTAIPQWISNPFPIPQKPSGNSFKGTPLGSFYKIFRAITQRGKGGTYQAIDFSQSEPRFCIVKEGRRFGEISWDKVDGYKLLKNEYDILMSLNKIFEESPRVFDSFEIRGNFYVTMEYVEGNSLHKLLRKRKRRFSLAQIMKFSIEIAEVIQNIHRAGWIWNDCKPANLIVTDKGKIRPIDFENAYQLTETARFNWKTRAFSADAKNRKATFGKAVDLYALGAVVYFLLTGKLFDPENPLKISFLRRAVPTEFVKITESLLSGSFSDASEVITQLEAIAIGRSRTEFSTCEIGTFL